MRYTTRPISDRTWLNTISKQPTRLRARLRSARAAAHPDRNEGDQALWDQVEQAAAALGLLS